MELIADVLSNDHKLNIETECERIIESGGRVQSFKDTQNPNESIGPRRVWLPDQEIPGLAMSRSMGDEVAHSVGVSAVPEVLEFTLGVSDRFVVIGSDGLWEFLTNEQVCEIVLPFYIEN
jgi:serine/threonine protein phosphatase PrpC